MDDDARRFADYILDFVKRVCLFQQDRAKVTRAVVEEMNGKVVGQAGTGPPTVDDGTSPPNANAEVPQADAGTDHYAEVGQGELPEREGPESGSPEEGQARTLRWNLLVSPCM